MIPLVRANLSYLTLKLHLGTKFAMKFAHYLLEAFKI